MIQVNCFWIRDSTISETWWTQLDCNVVDQGLYAPSAIDAKAVISYKTELASINTQWYKEFNTTLQSYKEASAAGVLDRLPNATWVELNATLAKNAKAAKDLGDFKKYAASKSSFNIKSMLQSWIDLCRIRKDLGLTWTVCDLQRNPQRTSIRWTLCLPCTKTTAFLLLDRTTFTMGLWHATVISSQT